MKKSFRSFEPTSLHAIGGKQGGSVRTDRPLPGPDTEKRRMAAAELTQHLESTPGACYLRLGDGELRFLLDAQNHRLDVTSINNFSHLRPSLEISFGSPSLMEKDVARLLSAYENASWLDRYEKAPFCRDHIGELKLNRSPDKRSNPTPETSCIHLDWAWYEMRDYLTRHRSLFCSAESALLQALLQTREYHSIAARFWPEEASLFFLQPRRDGKFLSEDLDQIKADISALIDQHHIDTLFLGLGGAAKIIGAELAAEKGVRAIDCGGLLRSLTYSGSDGHATWRSTHHPFTIRVPFGVFMQSLQKAHPAIDPVTLISKAHNQLCLEMIRKIPLEDSTCDLHDISAFSPTKQNRQYFFESYAAYRRHYYPWARKHPETHALLKEFHRWRLHKGLGFDAQLYQLGRKIFNLLRGRS